MAQLGSHRMLHGTKSMLRSMQAGLRWSRVALLLRALSAFGLTAI